MTLKTIEQKRAAFAYIRIIEVKANGNKEYKSFVGSFSSMILQNGLGQALAFLKAKGKPYHNYLYKHLNLWLIEY